MAASKANMLGSLGKLTELRQRIFFVIGALVVFRLGSFIPVPGVNPEAMSRMIEQGGGLLNMFNMFSGGALARFSVFALGVVPYISASIVVQMLGSVLPSWQQLRKEGDGGRRTLTKYTRWGTVGLAAFQSFGVAMALQKQGEMGGVQVVYTPGFGFIFASVVGLTAGTMFLMWLGEQMTERSIGNGMSMIIFAGIVTRFPSAIASTAQLVSEGSLNPAVVLLIIALVVLVTWFVVFFESAQRRIPIHHARRQQGRRLYAAQTQHLPLKLNMSGVIPPIFASSIILFPASAVSFFGGAGGAGGGGGGFLQVLANALSPGQALYTFLYGALIIFFCFFYTALVFDSRDTADNLKKSGAFVPGVRPGLMTGHYIDQVLTRLTVAGALYVTAVCLLPEILVTTWNIPFSFGGTSLLITVVVVMDFMSQLQAHLMSHQYSGLLEKSKLKTPGRGNSPARQH